MEAAMRMRILLSLLLMIGVAGTATAQHSRPGDMRSETMSRQAGEGMDDNLIWNVIGVLGLLGLLGVRKAHPDDSYHPAGLE
jgi:hypothetical protein